MLSYPQTLEGYPLASLIVVCQYVDMVCIYCNQSTLVANSRHQIQSNHIWRRRKCLTCNAIFTTHEQPALSQLFMVSRSRKKSLPFSRDALFLSILESCKHRPTNLSDASYLTQVVISKLCVGKQSGLVARDEIVHAAVQALSSFDAVAATLYTAYHPIQSNE